MFARNNTKNQAFIYLSSYNFLKESETRTDQRPEDYRKFETVGEERVGHLNYTITIENRKEKNRL